MVTAGAGQKGAGSDDGDGNADSTEWNGEGGTETVLETGMRLTIMMGSGWGDRRWLGRN